MPADRRPILSAVVFDLDGTLVDSVRDIARAINGVLAENHRPGISVDMVSRMMGDGALELMERAFVATGAAAESHHLPALAERLLDIYGGGRHADSVLYPGVSETLAELASRGLRFGVCTNKHYAMTCSLLDRFGIDRHFAVVIGGDTTSVLKPDPRILKAALDGLGVPPAETVMVGDSGNDILVARRLGVGAIAAGYGYPGVDPRTLGADAVIDAFIDLPAILDRAWTMPDRCRTGGNDAGKSLAHRLRFN